MALKAPEIHPIDALKTRSTGARRFFETKTDAIRLKKVFGEKRVEDILGDMAWSGGAGWIAKRAATEVAGRALDASGFVGWGIKAGAGAVSGATREYVRQMRDLDTGIAKKKYDALAPGSLEKTNVDTAKAELDIAQVDLDGAVTPAQQKIERANYREKKKAYNETLRRNLNLGLRDALRPSNFTKVDVKKMGKATALGAVYGVVGETIGHMIVDNLGSVIGGAAGAVGGNKGAERMGMTGRKRWATIGAGALAGAVGGHFAQDAITGGGMGVGTPGNPDVGGKVGSFFHERVAEKAKTEIPAAIAGGAIGAVVDKNKRWRGGLIGGALGGLAGYELTALEDSTGVFSGALDVPHQVGEVEVAGHRPISDTMGAVTDRLHDAGETGPGKWKLANAAGWVHDRVFGEDNPPVIKESFLAEHGKIPEDPKNQLFDQTRNMHSISQPIRIGDENHFGFQAVYSNNSADLHTPWELKPDTFGSDGMAFREIQWVDTSTGIRIPELNDTGVSFMDAKGHFFTNMDLEDPKVKAAMNAAGIDSSMIHKVSLGDKDFDRFSLAGVLKEHATFKPEGHNDFNFQNTHFEMMNNEGMVRLQGIDMAHGGNLYGNTIIGTLHEDDAGNKFFNLSEFTGTQEDQDSIIKGMEASGWIKNGDKLIPRATYQIDLPAVKLHPIVSMDLGQHADTVAQALPTTGARGEDVVAHLSSSVDSSTTPLGEAANVIPFPERTGVQVMDQLLPKSFVVHGDSFWESANHALPHVQEGWIDPNSYLSQKDHLITLIEGMAKTQGIDIHVGMNFNFQWLTPEAKLWLYRFLQTKNYADFAALRPELVAFIAQMKGSVVEEELTKAA